MQLDVDHVAHLARLDLTPAERETLAAQLPQILHYVDRLQELDTHGIEATFQVIPRADVLRDDDVRPSLRADEVLANAPWREGDCFRMPRILEE